jgi:undecaprenyl-diphosphatase
VRGNDYCFEQSINSRSLQERHHLRLWATPYVTANGARVWVGTAQFDKSISLTSSLFIPTHQIDPAVDKERDTIKNDLLGTAKVEAWQTYQMVEPLLGKNAVGSEFFTDGKADVFFLK